MAATKKTSWIGNAQHDVVLPSGTTIKIKLPNLPQMIKSGTVPNELVEVAIKSASNDNQDPTADDIKAVADFHTFLVVHTVVEPEITEADVPQLPSEDTEMIVEFATRQRDLDAVGNHIGGLDKLEDYRKFRDRALGRAAGLGL